MTKAELVKGFVSKLEEAKVMLPKGMQFYADADYWEKNPAGYILDECFDPLTEECFNSVEGCIACFDTITVKQMQAIDIPEGMEWKQVWAMLGRTGVLQQTPRVLVSGCQSYLRVRHNAYISCDKGAGFVMSKDLSGRSMCDTSDLDMAQAAQLCRLLRRYPVTCHALFYSYFAQVLAGFSEFPSLLRYNPIILGDYLKAVEDEYVNGNPMPNSKKVKPYHVPMYVSNKEVEGDARVIDLACYAGVFARLSLGASRVTLRLSQVDGEHIYSFDFPSWETREDWYWDNYEGRDLFAERYTAFMQYRFAVLLLALAGVEFNSLLFFTRKNKRLKYRDATGGVLSVRSIMDLKGALLR